MSLRVKVAAEDAAQYQYKPVTLRFDYRSQTSGFTGTSSALRRPGNPLCRPEAGSQFDCECASFSEVRMWSYEKSTSEWLLCTGQATMGAWQSPVLLISIPNANRRSRYTMVLLSASWEQPDVASVQWLFRREAVVAVCRDQGEMLDRRTQFWIVGHDR